MRLWRGLRPFLESVLAGLIGLGAGALIMWAWGYNPWPAYLAMFKESFGSVYGLASALANAIPLIFTALTFAVGARAGLFIIGAEGMMYMGALSAVAMSLFCLPPGIHAVLALALAALAGIVWGLIPAILRALRGVHEVISTIMFNWLSHFLAFYVAAHILVDPVRAEKTISVAHTSRLPLLLRGTDLSLGIVVASVAALLMYLYLWHTVSGYEVRAAGANLHAARYGGVSPKKTVLLVFILGGAVAGLAGAIEVTSRPPTYAVYADLSNLFGLGFAGIGVAMIGRIHPLGIIPAAVFYGGLEGGARFIQMIAGVPFQLIRAVQGAIVLALALPELLRIFRRLKRRPA